MTVALAAHAWLDIASVAVLYGIVALHSFAQGLNQPVRGAIVPRLVPMRQLPAANALFQLTMGSCLMVGPLLGALTVAGLGFRWAYTVDALSFAVSLWAMYKLPSLPPIPGEDGATSKAGFRSVVEGFRFLATRPNLRMTFLLDLAAMIFAMPRALFPVLGASVLGGTSSRWGCSPRRSRRGPCSRESSQEHSFASIITVARAPPPWPRGPCASWRSAR